MATNSGQVYNYAEAAIGNPDTPGINLVVVAWQRAQEFTGNGAANIYNDVAAYTSLIVEAVQ